jgi:uncharacterized membrane protein
MEVISMKLTPEERRKIYEEEKAKEEQEEEKRRPSPDATINLAPNIVGVLCYLGIWVTGIIFFILEQKNKWIRFHAAQSIVVFGGLGILTAILHWIPFVGWVFTAIIWIIGIILWLVLMSKAYNGERYKLPVAGDLAEVMADITFNIPETSAPPMPPPPPRRGRKAPAAAAAAPPPPTAPEKPKKPVHSFEYRKTGRITISSFAIAWSVVLLVVFNFFHQYIAYYSYDSVNKIWSWSSFFTNDISAWLPILNTALIISIIANIVLIFVNNKIIRESIHVISNGFNLAAIVTLLVVYPFNFDIIPNSDAAAWTTLGVRIGLVVIAVCVGISLLVRIIKLLESSVKAIMQNAD